MARSKEQFQTIRTQGAILPADVLQRINSLELDGLKPEHYHLPPSIKLNEAISQSWSRVLAFWKSFSEAREKLLDADETGALITRERWLLPLFQELGYGRLTTEKAPEIDGKLYSIERFWKAVPIHLVGCKLSIDRRAKGVRGAATASPHSLVQEFLNRSDDHLWAFVSNGLQLRILRDNLALSRQSYVEFDLEAMMDGEVYADFAMLWILCHQSRLEADKPEECWLEKWSKVAQEQGTRILTDLRDGVTRSIEALGTGFISHRKNDHLRRKLESGELTSQDYYRQLLRIVYRLLFLFVSEDRELLHPPEANEQACTLYDANYSTRYLRDLAAKMRGSKHADFWHILSLVSASLGKPDGCPELGLPGLGSFLWAGSSTPDLLGPAQSDGDQPVLIRNDDLLTAVRSLGFVERDRTLRVVDYRNLGSEELGSVYESLLELIPDINLQAKTFSLRSAAGNERKTTGSYYTPDSLVQCLLDSALEPVIEDRLKEAATKAKAGGRSIRDAQEEAILNITVCDPAVGSGHFLIAAAHRLARQLARVRTGDAEPVPEDHQHALRDVIRRCVYGVDLNPMAAELCKVALWMESLEPGKALTFLDSHIKVGNSLLGTTPELLAEPLPDAAFKPIQGDDKAKANEFKKRHKQEVKDDKKQQHYIFEDSPFLNLADMANDVIKLEAAPQENAEQVREIASRYARVVSDSGPARFLADAWCAAFVWPKKPDTADAITHRTLAEIRRSGQNGLLPWMRAEVTRLASEYGFFHWHLAFPQVFGPEGAGGFDCVLGNPPWDRISLKEREFFSGRDDEIASQTNSAVRARLIDALSTGNPDLHESFMSARQMALRTKHLLSTSNRFRYSAVGDINTFALFTDLYDQLNDADGACGIITQTQLVTEKTYGKLLRDLLGRQRIASCYAFENERFLFRGAHHSTRFVLLTLRSPATQVDCATGLWDVEWLQDESRRYAITPSDVARLNPDTHGIPQFRTRHDATIATSLYKRFRLLGDPRGVRSEISASRIMHDKDNADVINWDRDESLTAGRLPILESKLIEHFNHRYATYENVSADDVRRGYPRETSIDERDDPCFETLPRKWVALEDTPSRFAGFGRDWMLHVRKIANNIMVRTITAAITPKHPNNGSAAWVRCDAFSTTDYLFLCGVMNSFVFDYLARQKVSGVNVNSYHLMQLPIPDLPSERDDDLRRSIADSCFELSYTSNSLAGLARDYLATGNDDVPPPFRWNPNRRELIRAQLDALVAHAYELDGAELEWVIDAQAPSESFRVLREAEQKQYGEFRTKRLVLEAFVRLSEQGIAYAGLDPVPGVPRKADGSLSPQAQWTQQDWPGHIHQSAEAVR